MRHRYTYYILCMYVHILKMEVFLMGKNHYASLLETYFLTEHDLVHSV